MLVTKLKKCPKVLVTAVELTPSFCAKNGVLISIFRFAKSKKRLIVLIGCIPWGTNVSWYHIVPKDLLNQNILVTKLKTCPNAAQLTPFFCAQNYGSKSVFWFTESSNRLICLFGCTPWATKVS